MHNDLFKIAEGLFEDTELRSQLGRLVTRLLSTIRGQIKSTVCIFSMNEDRKCSQRSFYPQLTMSVSKRLSIMDALKLLIHSGMEVDSSHWTRFAFLVGFFRHPDCFY